MLSRAEMEQIIVQGGSVSIGGRVISRIQDLPSAADLATGDPKSEAAVLKDIDRQIAALQKQRKQIEQAQEQRKKESKAAPSDTSGTSSTAGDAGTSGEAAA